LRGVGDKRLPTKPLDEIGNGAFAAGDGPTGIVAGDFNGDRLPDLVTANYGAGSGNTASVLLGNADGSFQSATHYGTGVAPTGVAVACGLM